MTLTLHVLKLLAEARGLLVPEAMPRLDLRVRMSPPPSTGELNSALNEVERAGWAVSVRDEVEHTLKWKLTTAGQAVLAERGL